MNDLENDDRSLFDAARAGYEPSEEHRKSVLSGVLLRAGVVAGVTSAASAGAAASVAGPPLAAAAAPSGLAGLAFKVTLWMAIGGSIGVGGYEISRARSSAVRATAQVQGAANTPGVAARPGLAAPAAVQAAPTLDSSAPPDGPHAAPSNAARPASALAEAAPSAAGLASVPVAHQNATAHPMGAQAPAVAAFPSSASSASLAAPAPSALGLALSVEARALAKVQSALKEGRNAEALRLVEEQRQEFAHGELQQERDAATIVALCAVGRVADARAAARDFLAGSPRSPFATRIRASCAGTE